MKQTPVISNRDKNPQRRRWKRAWSLLPDMQTFDHDYADTIITRLRQWPQAAPSRTASLVAHLATSLRYTMGRGPARPVRVTWLARRIWRPLALWGLVPLSPTIDVAPWENDAASTDGDLETLHALYEEYLGLVQGGELVPPYHPVLGPLSIDEWARFHILHTAQHLQAACESSQHDIRYSSQSSA